LSHLRWYRICRALHLLRGIESIREGLALFDDSNGSDEIDDKHEIS